jgi:hypothetical protein
MSVVLEFVHMTIKDGKEEEFVRRRPEVERMLAGTAGFVDAELVRLEDGTWLDLVHWTGLTEAKAAAERLPTLPEVQAWLALIDQVVVMTHGKVQRRAHEHAA